MAKKRSSNAKKTLPPATPTQIGRIRSLGGDPEGLNVEEAKELLSELIEDRRSAEEEKRARERDDVDWVHMRVNDAYEWREIFHFRRITKAEARQIAQLFWDKGMSTYDVQPHDLCEHAGRMFPQKKSASGSGKARRSKRNGCGCLGLLMILLLLPTVIVLLC